MFRDNTTTSVLVPTVCFCWGVQAYQGDKYNNLTDMAASQWCINTDEIQACGMLSSQQASPPPPFCSWKDQNLANEKVTTPSNPTLPYNCLFIFASALFPPSRSPPSLPPPAWCPLPDCLLLQLSPAWLESQHTGEKKWKKRRGESNRVEGVEKQSN